MIVQGGRSQIHATLVALDTAFVEGFSVCSHHLFCRVDKSLASWALWSSHGGERHFDFFPIVFFFTDLFGFFSSK